MTSRAVALGAGLLLLLFPVGAAGERRFVEVSGQANVRLIAPPGSFESYGAEVYPMGDVNGDGFADAGVEDRVIFGGDELPRVLRLGTLGPKQGVELSAWFPRPAGDVNGDGIQDYHEVADPERGRGVVRVVYGTGTAADLAPPDGRHGFILNAGASARLFHLIPAGDVNGDGLDDLAGSVVNGAGRGYATVVYGGRSADTVDLAEPGDRGFRITGIDAGTYACGHGDNYSEGPLGIALAAPGDVNRDGRADLLLGVGGGDGGCGPGRRGQALLVFGRPGSGSVRFSKMRSGALRIVGPGGTGADVGAAGDVNGDRRPDLLVGAHGGPAVVFGRSRGGRIRLASLGNRGFRAWAGELYEGGPLTRAGDLNADRLGDFVVGNVVVYGERSSSRVLLNDLGGRGYRVLDRTSDVIDYGVGQVAPVGDLNGDRRPDLLVGATVLGPPGAHVLFGNGPPLVGVAPLRSSVPAERPPRLDLPLLCPGNAARLCRGRVRLVLPSGKTVFTARFRLLAGQLRKRPARLASAAVRALRLDGNLRLRAITAATDGRGHRAVTRRELYLIQR